MKYLINNPWLPFALFALVIVLLSECSITKDSTDPENGVSGMSLYTDAMTGCQYLSSPFGSLTPRMDRSGKQVCGAAR